MHLKGGARAPRQHPAAVGLCEGRILESAPRVEAEESAMVVRRSWVGVGWDGSPSLEGRGSARFVPVGTERPRPVEWTRAGQRFSSL